MDDKKNKVGTFTTGDKPVPLVTVSLALPEDAVENLRAVAKKDDRSLSYLLRKLIMELPEAQ